MPPIDAHKNSVRPLYFIALSDFFCACDFTEEYLKKMADCTLQVFYKNYIVYF